MNRLTIILILLLLRTISVNACTCGQTLSAKQAFKATKVIISVKVLKVLSSIDPKEKVISKNGDTLIREPVYGYAKLLLITKTYKGKLSNDTIIIDGDNSNCELFLEVGQSYIIYADLKNGNIQTNKCTRSGLLTNHPDIAFLEDKLKRQKKKNS